jgi:hypothetical protein
MRSAIVPIRELGSSEIAAWAALGDRAIQPNPLFEPTCLVPAARYLPNGTDMTVVVAEEGGRWYGCMPLCPAPSWRALHRPVLVNQLRRMIYDATPLLGRERTQETAACLLAGLRTAARGGAPGLVVLDWLDQGPAARSLREACDRAGVPNRVYHSWERPMLYRRGGTGHRDRHSGKSFRNVRRMRRRLAAEWGTVVMIDRSVAREGTEILLALENQGYKGRTGVAVLQHPGEPEWFREMCDGFRAERRLHVQTLEVGGQPLAAQLVLRAQDGLFVLKSAFDESFAAYSPGVQLHLDATDHLQGTTDAAWIDTCTYEGNDTLARLYPDRRAVASVVAATGDIGDRAALRAVSLARRALRRSREARARITRTAAPSSRTAVAALATAKR